MISHDLENLKNQFIRGQHIYGSVSYSHDLLDRMILVLADLEARARELEASVPSKTAKEETETQGNVVNLRQFRKIKKGDVA